jgi:2-amino-4-hydroxy-6-hydroxymethyldihydropteridine diphosphokinase
MNTLCYLGLGGNLGNPVVLFDQVLEFFAQHAQASQVKTSPKYESAPVESSGPNYINAVLELNWTGSSNELLEACMALENQLGRTRTVRNAPRLIDVDVLLFGSQQISTPSLLVPHPRMHLRRFVLQPLVDINPNVYIPGIGRAKNCLEHTLDQNVQRIEPSKNN